MKSGLDIVGVWSMLAWRQQRGREQLLPMGESPVGFIVYTAEGFVSVNIMRSARPLMLTGDFVNASDEEKALAFSGYLGYCGRYEVMEDRVCHHIEAASYPNWVGERQIRRLSWDGEILRLQAQPRTVNGVLVSATIDWKRLDSEPRHHASLPSTTGLRMP